MQPFILPPQPPSPTLLPLHPHHTMGNILSICPSSPPAQPTLSPSKPPPLNLWLYKYRLNLEPVVVGQQVALYHRAADCYNPDLAQAAPVVKGWINMILRRTPHWVMFRIVNSAGEEIARLGYPGYPDPQMLGFCDSLIQQPCPTAHVDTYHTTISTKNLTAITSK